MKHLIKQIFIIPLIITIFTFIAIIIFYKQTLKEFIYYKLNQEEILLINQKKDEIKRNIESSKEIINIIRYSVYESFYKELKKFLSIVTNHYLEIIDKEQFLNAHFLGYIHVFEINSIKSEKIVKKKIDNKEYLFLLKNNKKYFIVKNNILAIGVDVKDIKQIVAKYFFKYLDYFNKNRNDYIAVGEILTFNPKDDGVFGRILYMPPKLKSLIGKPLSYNKPDIKGNYYRKKYFQCLKENKGCFIEYYFKNPKTDKLEPKISYFSLYKPYNWNIVEGFYKSDVLMTITKIKKDLQVQYKKLFINLIIILTAISLLGFFIAFILMSKILKRIDLDYEKLKNEYSLTQQEILKKIFYDDLTKLPNRNKLLEDIKNYNSLVLIDIDDFSLLNDIYGFEIGDEILVYVSNLLKHKYKDVYRLGSDEFAIGLRGVIDEKILSQISLIHLNYNDIHISVTIGASIKPDLLKTSELALKYAMMHRNKKYYLYNEEIYNEQKNYMQQINKLKKVLITQDVIPYYQCIVDKNKNLFKYESLMRLKIDDKIKTPFEFMDLIKKAKVYELFTRIMVKKVVNDIKENKIENVSINLSFEDIANEYTKEYILNLIDSDIGNKLTIEILESESIENFEIVIEFIREVKKRGVSIAIDDFGSGYSNFVEVLKLKPDFIKIDASLVKNIHEKESFEMIKFIVSFSKKFNIKTIAEFVDNEESFNILKEIGVDYFQGYYFCKPKPLNAIFDKIL